MEEKELEMAEALAEGERAASIALARQRIAPESSPDFDGIHCIDCLSAIHKDRLAMKRIRCTGCQTALEKREKQYAR